MSPPPRRTRGLLLGLGVALAAAAVIAFLVLGGGDGEKADTTADPATTALMLSSETTGLATRIGAETGNLADSIAGGDSTQRSAKALADSEAEAEDLGERAASELPSDDPIRADLTTATTGLAEASANLEGVADDPEAASASADAESAKDEMVDALGGLEDALAELESDFTAEGEADAAASVKSSLGELRGNRDQLTGAFDSLIQALG